MPVEEKREEPMDPLRDRRPRRQTLPQLRKAETRARLLDAARSVFSAHGYELASVGRIADEAGVSKGALYVHFESKEALFRELLLDHVQRRSAATAATLGPDVPLRDGVLRIVEGAWALHDEDGPCPSLSTEFFAMAGRHDWGREAMTSILDHCSSALVRFLDAAKARGEVRQDLNSLTTARMMLALHDGLVLQWRNRPDADLPAEFVAPMAEMILCYIGSPEGAS